ncbi:hypothetical protein AB4876_02705 [Zhongshania guokunii]|uniref:Uncharacterized protein n=1 Tax=Zhongshania guokunii TaxID=641783 RepID=A0ABV3U1N3_9GAMM
MKFLYSWIENTRRTVEVLSVTLLAIYLIFTISNLFNIDLPGVIIIPALALTFILPFGILVAILTNNEPFKKVTSTLWSKSVISIFLIAYTAMSNVWASTVINEIFGVSASYFTITQTFLTLVYFVVTIMKALFSGLFITVITSAAFILWFFISFGGSLKSTVTKIAYLIVGVILVTATYTMISHADNSIKTFARYIAAWGDSYKQHQCAEDYGVNNGIVFLAPNKVLVLKNKFNANGSVNKYPPVETCTIK